MVLRWYFRRELRTRFPVNKDRTHLTGTSRLVLAGILAEAGVLMVASAMGIDLGLPTCVCAVVITAGLLIRTRTNPLSVIRGVSWSVIPLVAGLFVLVGAMESIGAVEWCAAALRWASRLPGNLGALAAAGATGVGNNLVNNLPLALIAGSTLKITHARGLIADAVMIGVDLGPNLSVTGSLATILWLIALRREGVNVSFASFLKVGALAMPIALALAVAGAMLLGRG
jgi:arsenical pump membrane protein